MKLNPCPFYASENLRTPKIPKISQDLTTFDLLVSCVECLNCGADGPKIAYVNDVFKG